MKNTDALDEMKAKFIYDHSKRMWSKHYSECCEAPLEQKMMYKGKVVKPDFKLQSPTKIPIKKTVYRKWWRLWKPKSWVITTGHETKTTYKEVQSRYFCMNCGKQTKDKWEFIHEDNSPRLNPNKGVSDGQSLVSKTKRGGSTPPTPATLNNKEQYE